MTTDSDRAVRLVAGLPDEVLTALSRPSLQAEDLRQLAEGLMDQAARVTLSRLVREVQKGSITPAFLGGVAAGLLHTRPRQPELELVLSGPSAGLHRETAGVVAELIGTAQTSILLTSYVVQHADIPLAMLTEAAQRGVEVTCVLDVKALTGPQVAQLHAFVQGGAAQGVTALVWNPTEEPTTMHAKTLVVDAEISLVTSANLTARALTENVEVGVLIRDRRLARAIRGHFDHLRTCGVLVPWSCE